MTTKIATGHYKLALDKNDPLPQPPRPALTSTHVGRRQPTSASGTAMDSHQSHVGPWPIKRHHSVPDGSVHLFTPRNSPPNLARRLGVEKLEVQLGEKPGRRNTAPDSVRTLQFDTWQGFLPPKVPKAQRAPTHQIELTPADEPLYTCDVIKKQIQADLLQPIVLLGSSTFIAIPAVMIYLFAIERFKDVGMSENQSLRGPLPMLASAVSMIAGFVAGIALSALDQIKQGRGLKNRSISVELMAGFTFGLFLTICMLLFAQVLLYNKCSN